MVERGTMVRRVDVEEVFLLATVPGLHPAMFFMGTTIT
jgi:hypothetical protein